MNTSALNPLFSSRNRLKLGTFASNASHGGAMSMIEGAHKATWPDVTALAKIADQASFEALVPIARWRGFGGKTNFNGSSFETFTWAAGLAATTRNVGVFSTCHVPAFHPILAAKQTTTVDHISGGRFALNIVCGCYEDEFRMFGQRVMEHELRYDYAEEWLEVLKKLWTSEEEFDFEGRFFRIEKGFSQPKPLQAPYPALMSAGASERGVHFACKNCDMIFTSVKGGPAGEAKAQIKALREIARSNYRRDIQVWTSVTVIQGDTERQARDFLHHCVSERGDEEAVDNMLRLMKIEGRGDRIAGMRARFMAGWGGIPLVGTAEQITQQMAELADTGLDGCLITSPRYEEGLRRFASEVIPLMKQAGLRT